MRKIHRADAELYQTFLPTDLSDEPKLLNNGLAELPVEIQLVADALRTRLEQFSQQERNIKGLIQMAQLALDEDEFLRTAIFLSEAVEIAITQGIPGDEIQDERLRSVRNWLAHAGKLSSRSKDQEVRECVSNRNSLRLFFQNHIDRLKSDTQST